MVYGGNMDKVEPATTHALTAKSFGVLTWGDVAVDEARPLLQQALEPL